MTDWPGAPREEGGDLYDASGGGDAQVFEQELAAAQAAQAAGDGDRARLLLDQALRHAPTDQRARNLLGLTLFKLGDLEKAEAIYRGLIDDHPADPTLRVNLGLVFLKRGASSDAARCFSTALDLQPEHVKAQNYLGLALAQKGEHAQARDWFVRCGNAAMAERMSALLAVAATRDLTPPASPAGAIGPVTVGRIVPAPSAPISVPPPSAPPPRRPHADPGTTSEFAAPRSSFAQTGEFARVPPSSEPARAAQAPAAAALAKTRPDDPARTSEMAPLAPAGAGWGAIPTPLSIPKLGSATTPGWQAPPRAIPSETATPPAPRAHPSPAASGDAAAATPLRAEPARDPVADTDPTLQPPSMSSAPAEPPRAAAPLPAPPSAAPAATPAPPAAVSPAPAAPSAPASPAPAPPGEVAGPNSWPPAPPLFVPAPPTDAPLAAASSAGAPRPVEPTQLSSYTSQRRLEVPASGSSFAIGSSELVIQVRGEMLTRLDGLVASWGTATVRSELKRFRGKATDKPFGDGARRMLRVAGEGRFVIAREGRAFTPLELGDEPAYFREEVLFAFEESLVFENGRVPSKLGGDLHLVHLRGRGRLLLVSSGEPRAVEVRKGEPLRIPMDQLVGWHGPLIQPRVVPIVEETPELGIALELSGEGRALVDTPGDS